MSGALPPVPDLIPIAALRGTAVGGGGAERRQQQQQQRQRRRQDRRSSSPPAPPPLDGDDAAAAAIDSGGRSRGPRRARKARKQQEGHHRHHRHHRHRHAANGTNAGTTPPQPQPPPTAAVNPIFVWVRQEDNRIVDVKCEDYDKRNRILLTKTPQGWRAIPRTETLVPTLRDQDDESAPGRRVRRTRKSCAKVKRRSTAVQVDDAWTSGPVNVESHLPSHTIQKRTPNGEDIDDDEEEDASSVNSDVNFGARARNSVECGGNKTCDVTPLDNLLAVAELEFKQQIQTEEWNKSSATNEEERLQDMTQLAGDEGNAHHQKTEECDYNEEEENNLVMDDILSRLEQSLRSPENYHEEANECNSTEAVSSKEQVKEAEVDTSCNERVDEIVPEPYFEQKEAENYEDPDVLVGSSTNPDPNEDVPTDLTVSKTNFDTYPNNCDDMIPTDLSIPKNKPLSPLRPLTPPSPSQNSETIQSPQPSGIPAVPPSPDIFHNNTNNKTKSIFLESLLTSSTQKVALTSEVTLTRQKEPLDLGKCRKSASPTVTCSEEVKNGPSLADMEPLAKKFKVEDITLKTLLDPELAKASEEAKNATPETPRLLELLTSEAEADALTQLKQVLADASLKVPDPMLVPKDRLSLILSSPAKEIPRLLKQRPELRLPEALAYPHLLQDPDILVITLAQLHTIIQKQCQPLPLKNAKEAEAERSSDSKEASKRDAPREPQSTAKSKAAEEERGKSSDQKKEGPPRQMNELAGDIDAATNAAFNQMMWLPYLNQLEAAAASFGNNPDLVKVLSSMFPMYANQVPDMSHLFNARIPPPVGFPLQPPVNYNPLEYSMWQEAIVQANMLRPKNPFDAYGGKNTYRECLDRTKMQGVSSKKPAQKMSHVQEKYNPFYMPGIHSAQPMHNSFVPGAFPHASSAQNLQIPQYNPLLGQVQDRKAGGSQPYSPRNPQYSKYDQHHAKSLNPLYHRHQSKPDKKYQTKTPTSQQQRHRSPPKEPPRKGEEVSRHHHQPMDLSGSSPGGGGKPKVKQHPVEHAAAPKAQKHDEGTPEVGSTTASIEEMQESQKHLWHPLFGSQKGYSSPWNWTTVTATGE